MRPGSFHLKARLLILVLASGPLACMSGSQSGMATPTPSPRMACQGDDHSIDEVQLGWQFCYPATWRYRERAAPVDTPKGIDTTFDIVVFSPNTPDDGKFGFMIVGTYQRQDADHLAGWVQKYDPDQTSLQPIAWGNALEAVRSDSGRRFALTPHHIVELDIREGIGNLDVENVMSSHLATWRFEY